MSRNKLDKKNDNIICNYLINTFLKFLSLLNINLIICRVSLLIIPFFLIV